MEALGGLPVLSLACWINSEVLRKVYLNARRSHGQIMDVALREFALM
jgi:hypothetical protein